MRKKLAAHLRDHPPADPETVEGMGNFMVNLSAEGFREIDKRLKARKENDEPGGTKPTTP
jgi:hypothetical protein